MKDKKKINVLFSILCTLLCLMLFSIPAAVAEPTFDENAGMDESLVFPPEVRLMVYVDGTLSDELSRAYGKNIFLLGFRCCSQRRKHSEL